MTLQFPHGPVRILHLRILWQRLLDSAESFGYLIPSFRPRVLKVWLLRWAGANSPGGGTENLNTIPRCTLAHARLNRS